MKKIYLIAFLLSCLFVGFSVLISHSEICCMFSASRYYGWPNDFLILNLTTDSFETARMVKTASTIELMKNGWDFKFGAHYLGSHGISSSAYMNLVANFVFYYLISFILIKIYLYQKVFFKNKKASTKMDKTVDL